MSYTAVDRSVHRPRVLVLSGYDAASHRRWRTQLTEILQGYDWHARVLSPRFFRWRIRGNPLSWLNEPCFQEKWDLVVATSMVDLATLRGVHPSLACTPCILYMHENQFAFPVSEGQNASVDPQMVNLYGALSANCVVFNSDWNRESFLQGVQGFLSKMPDGVPPGVVEQLRNKSRVIPVPIEDRLFVEDATQASLSCPHILWNHRWEYDKGPDRLQAFLHALDRRSIPFRLSVVGERFRKYPRVFDEIYHHFENRIEHWGYLDCRSDYDKLLVDADVVISTAVHDFQGLSMLEAMASGCLPLAPDRLSYPEYVPDSCRYTSHSTDKSAEAEAAVDCLEAMLKSPPARYLPVKWKASELASEYASLIEGIIGV